MANFVSPEQNQSPPWPTPTRSIVAVIIVALGLVALVLLRGVVTLLIIGVVVAYIFRPVVRALRRITRLPRSVVAALLYLALLALAIGAVLALTPLVVRQLDNLQTQLASLLNDLNAMAPGTTINIAGFPISVENISDEINNAIDEALRGLISESLGLVRDIAETLLLIVFTILTSFYLTRDMEKFGLALKGLVPRSYQRDTDLMLVELDHIWSAFFRGQITLALVVSVLLTIVASIIGLPFPLLLGLLGGLLEFLPSIGHTIWGAIVIILALVEGSTNLPVSNATFALIVAIIYVVFTQVDINFLIPTIIGGHINLHPLLVIFGVIGGAAVGGVLGVALAAPMIASLRILGRYLYAKLFGMYPFPMVGPPAAPWEERLALAQELSQQKANKPGLWQRIAGRTPGKEAKP